MALALWSYCDKLVYDVTVGANVEKTGRETFFDSFDYADQLSTYSDRGAT